jgi:hypothetical protein
LIAMLVMSTQQLNTMDSGTSGRSETCCRGEGRCVRWSLGGVIAVKAGTAMMPQLLFLSKYKSFSSPALLHPTTLTLSSASGVSRLSSQSVSVYTSQGMYCVASIALLVELDSTPSFVKAHPMASTIGKDRS